MFLSELAGFFSDDRFLANLIAVGAVVAGLILCSLALRFLISHGSHRLTRWIGLEKLHALGREATRHGHTLLFWLTAAAVVGTFVAGLAYHLLGRDVRLDLGEWYRRRTLDDFLHMGLAAGALVGLVILTWFVLNCLRRALPAAEAYAVAHLSRDGNEAKVRRWFTLLDGYVLVSVRLGALWAAGHLVGLGRFADLTLGFCWRVATILVVARLITLACRTVSRAAAEYGDRRFAESGFRRYWERVTRLFPFGERCLDAAVYVTAASLCVRELQFIHVVADFGPRLVQCIGIFFCSRVVIELLAVLLNEAFGLCAADGAGGDTQADQKGRTLVPLLNSLSQYVIYFGAVVLMLGVLGVDTTPIMAGAGILGLAVGLGGQSLVTDVVSGFFILFENQFLVGDHVKIGDAAGTVEEVGMRVTKIRDAHGKLHIIPNGQIKGVVSFSKGYVNAVVDYSVGSGQDVEAVFRAMRRAGDLLRQQRDEVLDETEIQGIVDLGESKMTVRAVTRVKPGAHAAVESEYRRLLRQVLDEQARVAPRLAA